MMHFLRSPSTFRLDSENLMTSPPSVAFYWDFVKIIIKYIYECKSLLVFFLLFHSFLLFSTFWLLIYDICVLQVSRFASLVVSHILDIYTVSNNSIFLLFAVAAWEFVLSSEEQTNGKLVVAAIASWVNKSYTIVLVLAFLVDGGSVPIANFLCKFTLNV
jgi:hypothetical protein